MIKEAIRRTEVAFENSGYWIHDHPKRVILMMLFNRRIPGFPTPLNPVLYFNRIFF
jgi:hypothetical protein